MGKDIVIDKSLRFDYYRHIDERKYNDMEEKLPLDGKYLMYKDKPLVRQDNVIVYGDMREKYYLFLMILTTKQENGNEVPDRILIQVLSSDGKEIVKQGEKSGLYEALDLGIIWLDRALAQ